MKKMFLLSIRFILNTVIAVVYGTIVIILLTRFSRFEKELIPIGVGIICLSMGVMLSSKPNPFKAAQNDHHHSPTLDTIGVFIQKSEYGKTPGTPMVNEKYLSVKILYERQWYEFILYGLLSFGLTAFYYKAYF